MTSAEREPSFPRDLSFSPRLPPNSDPQQPLPPLPLPPAHDASSFAAALDALRQVLGGDYVFHELAQVAQYSRSFQHSPDGESWASAAIAPADLDQLKDVVALARQHRLPLWPISHGRNFGYGAARPATPGQIVLDLQRMNRIVEVNDELGYLVCEPGVMYTQIKQYLRERSLRYWISLPDLGPLTGPVGNALEHGVGYTPYGDHFLHTCGMEVLLSDGTLFHTGTGGVPSARTAHVYKWSFGPYLDGIFTQSNFGIVTKLGIWLMPEPEEFLSFAVLLERDEAMPAYVEALRELLLAQHIQSTVTLGQFRCNLNQLGPRERIHKGAGSISTERAEQLRQFLGAPVWSSFAAIYGAKRVVDAQWALVQQRLQTIPGLTLVTKDNLEEFPLLRQLFEHRTSSLRGDGYPELLQETVGWRPNGGIVWFSPVVPTVGRLVQEQHELASRIILEHGLDPLTGYIVRGRYVHHLISLVFDRTCPEERAAVGRCYRALLEVHTKLGYPVYRAPVTMMADVAATYEPALRDVWQRIKNALDPDGLIAPGKSGINATRR